VAVRAFLDGRSDAPVRTLELAMQQAAEQLAFEKAAVIRDRLALVRWLHERVQHFHANVDRLTFRYHAVGPDTQEWVYLVRRGTVRAELPAPKTPEERAAFRELAAKVFTGPDPSGADIPTISWPAGFVGAPQKRRVPASPCGAPGSPRPDASCACLSSKMIPASRG
jgi:excinuclease ABC subunit C